MSSASPQSSSGISVSKPSGRKGSRKVRTGCITCKARKVKCDETKPACLRCVKTGRRCDGYNPVTPPSTGRSGLALSPCATPEFETVEERRAFDYYRNRSAPLIGSAMDLDFWAGLVVKLSTREPVVRHAMLALSSLHESLSFAGHDVSAQRSFALTEYGRAITNIRKWDSQKCSEAIPLLVCLLFVCIEFLLGDEVSSQLHICQGREILFRMERSHSPETSLVKRYLAPVYMRLSLPGFFRASRPSPMPRHLVEHTAVPAEFESIEEARALLYYLMDDTLRLTVEGKPAVYEPSLAANQWEDLQREQQRLASQLLQWNIAFTMLIAGLPPTQSQAVTEMQKLLQILYESSYIWVSTALQPLELAYDSHISSFITVVSHATTIIQNNMSQSNPKPFSFETELIAPLYWTAIKCRHPLLRRTALKLLMRDEMRHRRENIWATETTVAIASRVIELEEQAVADSASPGVSWDQLFSETQNNLPIPPGVIPGVQFEATQYGLDEANLGATPAHHRPGHQHEVYPGELQVPLNQPPTIANSALDVASWPAWDELGDVPPGAKDSFNPLRQKSREPRPFVPPPIDPAPPMTVNLEAYGPEPPFGIPEEMRIKNTLIGPVQDGGVWATMFRSAKDGLGTWDVTREFLRL